MANTENKKSADIGSPIGIFLGVVIILLGIYMQDAPGKKYSDMLAWFVSPSSVLIELGSTLAAALVAIPINSLKNIPSVMVIIIRNLDFDYLGVIEQILSFGSNVNIVIKSTIPVNFTENICQRFKTNSRYKTTCLSSTSSETICPTTSSRTISTPKL